MAYAQAAALLPHERAWGTSGEIVTRMMMINPSENSGDGMGNGLKQFLLEGDAPLDAKKRHDEIDSAAKRQRDIISRRRLLRQKLLRMKLSDFEGRISGPLGLLRSQTSECSQDHSAILTKLDRLLWVVAQHYAATIHRENLIYSHRLALEQALCKRLKSSAEASLALSLFSLHLENETSGRVKLHRLAENHPQNIRCRKAARENVKDGYFEASGSGLDILNVYKLENKNLLRSFQEAAKMHGSSKIKGLFTSVPAECLQRVIVSGMNEWDQNNASSFFQRTWYTYSDGGVGFAEKRIADANNARFPATFSRFSTLKCDRKEALGDGDDDVRYLALCRVIIGKVFVTSKGYPGFPGGTEFTSSSYDSMYNPGEEEYLVLRREHVLPEFFIQYRYSERKRKTLAQNKEGSRHDLLPCDLSISTNSKLIAALDAAVSGKGNSRDSALDENCELSWESSFRCSHREYLAVREKESLVDWTIIRRNAQKQREGLLRYVAVILADASDAGASLNARDRDALEGELAGRRGRPQREMLLGSTSSKPFSRRHELAKKLEQLRAKRELLEDELGDETLRTQQLKKTSVLRVRR